jgi:two-component system LytT family sensor kinase
VVSFCADDINEPVHVAPLLFIAFVENAFKYIGFNENRINRVDISIKYQNSDLLLKVYNTKDSFIAGNDERSSGLGIPNTKRRLEILYPQKHKLQITDSMDSFEVNLTLSDV